MIKNSVYNTSLTKRAFLKQGSACFLALCSTPFLAYPRGLHAQTARKGLIKTKLSPYFNSLTGGTAQCGLCPNQCIISEGKRGLCRVRENRGGRIYSLVYGNPCAINLDPIEKKPFLHVLPGTTSLSVATAGCNLACKFCQNWEISMAFPEEVYSYEASPEMLVTKAKEMGARSIAYSYVEPTIFYEYMYDIAVIARKAGLLNVVHTNGFINDQPLRALCKVLDAAQVDLKGFTQGFYRDLCQGALAPVLETLKTVKQEKIHLEITNLVIPTKNDDMSKIQEMCLWICRELGADTPVHFNRFYPLHKLNRLPSTPVSTLEAAHKTALNCGLEYVYIGNVPGHETCNTFCPACKKMIIKRMGYMIEEMGVTEGACPYCGNAMPGIWV